MRIEHETLCRIKRFVKVCVGIFCISFIWTCCVLVLSVVPSDLDLIKILLTDKLVFLMNFLPIILSMSLFLFLTNKVWRSSIIISVLVFVIAEVNRFKIYFRDDPFLFEDLLLFNEAKNMIGKYELFLDEVSLAVLLGMVIVNIIIYLFFRVEESRGIIRVVGTSITILCLVLTINGLYFCDKKIYAQTWHWEFGSEWKYTNQYMSRGVIYSFVRSIPDAFSIPPENYSKQAAEEILGKYANVDIPEEKKVHVISIMLEAYNDFSQYEGVEFENDPYRNFHEMKENSYYGKLFTNIFAAGTVDTERAFLTGYGEPDFSNKPIESYVRYFKSQGYYTEAMHPSYGWFYNRRNINMNLGFDSFLFYENTFSNLKQEDLCKELYHGLLSDYDFFDYIIEGYEKSVQNNKKYFNFSVTYQNHGPYETSAITDIEYLSRKAEYSEAEYNVINNYLHGIACTDEAIGKLHEYIDRQNEPIVLILFGDHNPWLGDENSGYSMLDINLDLSTVEGVSNYYQTPYIIYANDSAKEVFGKSFSDKGATISPMFLMNEFFDYVELEGPRYLNYLHDMKADYSVINDVVVKKNEMYFFRECILNEKMIAEQAMVEYYMKNHLKIE